MSDSLDNLPIFPLGTVLVPRMVLPLRIFEDRYKKMLEECRSEESGFGVSLIRSGEEVGGDARPYDIGTVARIRDERSLPNDESLIIAVGTTRFRILRMTQDEPFLRAAVVPVEDDSSTASVTAHEVKALAEKAQELFEVLTGESKPDALPDDPVALAWVLTARLPIENPRRQEFLEMTSLTQRLASLESWVERLMPEARKRAEVRTEAKRIVQTNGKMSHLKE